MAFEIASFADLMALEPHGPDVYIGVGPSYPWGRVYGGQVAAQGLRAAAHTVAPDYHVHSLHAYFVRGGDYDEPIRFEVERLRNGRSFVTRQVVARQSSGAILNLSASFQLLEDAPDIAPIEMPEVPGPENIPTPDDEWTTLLLRRPIPDTPPGRATCWLRHTTPIGDDPVLQACALAYTSDDMPTEASWKLHPDGSRNDHDSFISASLDHAVWFHRPAPADEWQLHDLRSHGLAGARGLNIGEVFSPAGLHVATITQEILLRRRSG